MDTPSFAELGLPPSLVEAAESLGFEQPSAIQAKAIPAAMSGNDIIGLSQTGSGKTAAFTLPALSKIDLKLKKPQVLILCPTRELAVQVCEEVHRLGSKMEGLQAVPVYGGAPIDRQIRSLKNGAQLLVGTPGRLLDHLRRKTFDPRQVETVVLDEADRMLDMGFREEMEELLSDMPETRQTLFFSATMNKGVERFIKNFGNDPQTVEIKRQALTVESIDQSYYEVRNRSKVEVASRVLDMENPRLAIIFCNTKRSVDEVTESLLARGYAVDRLHGDITQQMRERTLSRFRDGIVELLVATDVAARGLDVDDIDMVFNFDLPQDPEDYVHRIGRTGRAGRSGKAISFVFGRDIYRLSTVEKYTRQQIRREKIPSQEQVEGKRADQLFESLKERLESGNFVSQQDQVDRLLDQGHTPTDIVGALFTMLREKTGREGETITEDREPDKGERRSSDRGDKRDRRDKRDRDGGNRERRKERGSERRNQKGPADGMKCLFLSVGKTHGVRPADIAGMMYREADVPKGALGRITIFPRHCLVDIQPDFAEQAIRGLDRAKVRGNRFKIGYDRREG